MLKRDNESFDLLTVLKQAKDPFDHLAIFRPRGYGVGPGFEPDSRLRVGHSQCSQELAVLSF